ATKGGTSNERGSVYSSGSEATAVLSTLKRSPIRLWSAPALARAPPAPLPRCDAILITGGGPPAHHVYSAGSRPRAGARIWWGDESECGMSRRHVGQRGSQHVKACAISRRMVGKESAKWSSGRDFERTRSTLPSGRG